LKKLNKTKIQTLNILVVIARFIPLIGIIETKLVSPEINQKEFFKKMKVFLAQLNYATLLQPKHVYLKQKELFGIIKFALISLVILPILPRNLVT
jgi:hypothetical protein